MPTGTSSTATGAFGRLFAFWAVLACAQPVAADSCAPPPALSVAEVRTVVDGDTLRLVDGTRVRMVGLDAPEIGRDGAPDAPHAVAARDHLRTLVDLAGGRVRLLGNGSDDHGRRLAVVYSDRHGDLAAHLIRRGLAFASVVPPNLEGLDCRQAAEAAARAQDAGLWAGDAVPLTAVSRTGFAVVRGAGTAWRVRRDDRLLPLDGGLVIRVRDADAHWFEAGGFERFAHSTLEVRGWVHPWHAGSRAITVRHPAAIEVVRD